MPPHVAFAFTTFNRCDIKFGISKRSSEAVSWIASPRRRRNSTSQTKYELELGTPIHCIGPEH